MIYPKNCVCMSSCVAESARAYSMKEDVTYTVGQNDFSISAFLGVWGEVNDLLLCYVLHTRMV